MLPLWNRQRFFLCVFHPDQSEPAASYVLIRSCILESAAAVLARNVTYPWTDSGFAVHAVLLSERSRSSSVKEITRKQIWKRPTGRFHSNHLWRRSRREGGKEAWGLPSCPGAYCPPRRVFFLSTPHFASDSYSWSISADRGWPLLNCLVSLLLTNHIACQLGAQMDPLLPAARWFMSRGCGCHRIQTQHKHRRDAWHPNCPVCPMCPHDRWFSRPAHSRRVWVSSCLGFIVQRVPGNIS